MQIRSRLEHFPVAFFSTVMGMAGLAIAWEKGHEVLSLPETVGLALAAIVAGQLALVLGLFLAKLALHRAAVLDELRHPVKLSFFPTISISFLLLAIAALPAVPEVARALWYLGVSLHLLFTLYVINAWMHHPQFEVHHMNPAWYIPAVGNVLVPVGGVALGHTEISWFFFSIGMVFWLVLLTIIFYRMLFHQPLPERLMPTLFILIAPPAVGFIAYYKLTGSIDPLARVLFGAALFFTLLLLVQIHRFARLKFFLSWWAYSFPLAAMTIASLVMHEATGVGGYRVLGAALLALTTAVVGLLLVRTTKAIRDRGICLPEA
jgi:tellurite resistance protein